MKEKAGLPGKSGDPTEIVFDAVSLLCFSLASLIVFSVGTGSLRFLMNGWGTFLVTALLICAGGVSTLTMIVYYQVRIARGRRVDCSRMVAQSLYYFMLFSLALVWCLFVPSPTLAESYLGALLCFGVWGIIFSGAVLVKGWRPEELQPANEDAPEK